VKRIKKSVAAFFDENGNRVETSIESKIRKWLLREGIPFIQEYKITSHGQNRFYDFYITDGLTYHILVECDGGFFHSQNYLEGKQKRSKLSKIQKKNLYNDKKKNRIAQKVGIPLLRFWEKDIKYGFENVTKAILNEIERQTKITSDFQP
jgi:very-short-patch-repair endonuclease